MDDSVDQVLARYAELVRACPHNLLSPRGLEELETRHIAESRAFAAALPADIDLVDVGPGGGLPGMVVAIVRPDVRVTMVEATRKKADFLRESADVLDVEVSVHHGRIEDLGAAELAARFDVASARAVASLERLVPWIFPALTPEGELWAIKGDRWAEELGEAQKAMAKVRVRALHTPDIPSRAELATPESPTVVIIGRDRVPSG